MAPQLFVAAGGGGDAIAAAMVAASENSPGLVSIATYSWDRLLFDPVPGPRTVQDFEALEAAGEHNYRVTSDTSSRSPAASTLPPLAAALDAALYLLDPADGAVGIRAQLRELTDQVGAARVRIVDVGGDILARGDEEELRSPLADSLVLAACDPARTDVLIAGPGLDGELAENDVRDRLSRMGARGPMRLDGSQLPSFGPIFEWHPSESSGLLWAAATGVNGTVEIRDHAAPIHLGEDSGEVWTLDADSVLEVNSIARDLRRSSSLDDAEGIVREHSGRSELDYERSKASSLPREAQQMPDETERHERLIEAEDRAQERGANFVTIRRLLERLGLPPDSGREWLRNERPESYQPPLWRVS